MRPRAGPVRALGYISEADPRQAGTAMLKRISEVARVAAWTYDIQTDDLVLLTDGAGTTGVPEEEIATLVRQPETFLGPDESNRVRKAMHDAGAEAAGWDFVYSRRLSPSTTVWRRTFAQVDAERGVAVRLHGGVQDITHLRDLEATYLSARKMEAMALLAGGIAHDFANVVTALDGFRDSVALSLPEDHACQADLAQMGDMLRSATGLSRQLLALARRQVLKPAVVSLNELLADMRPLLQRMVGDTVSIEVEPGGGLWRVVADRSQLEQVILNLALNARDAMPHGGRLSLPYQECRLRRSPQRGVRGAPGRPAGGARGAGHRRGHESPHARPSLRAVLYDQAARLLQRPRPADLPRRHPAAQRASGGGQRPRGRHQVSDLAPSRQG